MGYSHSAELGAASHALATCASHSHRSSAEITITNLNISNKTSVGTITYFEIMSNAIIPHTVTI